MRKWLIAGGAVVKRTPSKSLLTQTQGLLNGDLQQVHLLGFLCLVDAKASLYSTPASMSVCHT